MEKIWNKPIIVLTHNDFDGVGSPIVLKNIAGKTGDEVKAVYYTNNGDVEKTIDDIIAKYGVEGYKLFICDHSPTLAHYNLMVEKGIDFMIFDHHKSSKIQGLEHVVFNIERSATAIFTGYLVDELSKAVGGFKTAELYNEVINFVYHVNDYDMWIHESPHSKRINRLLYETSINHFVERFSNNPSADFTEVEEIIVSTSEKKMQNYINKAEKHTHFYVDRLGHGYGVVFADQYQSELGHQLLELHPIDYIFMVNAQSSKVSLRSNGKVDVSEVAKRFAYLLETDSGGHHAAAGFGFTPNDLPKVYHMLQAY